MAIVSLDSPYFSGLTCTFKLLPSKHIVTGIWHVGPFTILF